MASGFRLGIAALLLASGCSGVPSKPPGDTAATPASEAATDASAGCPPTWSYALPQGPAQGWEGLCVASPERNQSPIVLSPDRPTRPGTGNLTVTFGDNPLAITNMGYTASVPLSGSWFKVGEGPEFHAYEVHFHAPSEHILTAFSNSPLDLEMHIKTHTLDGQNAVLAVLFSATGAANPNLRPIFDFVSPALPLCREVKPDPLPVVQLGPLLPMGPPVGRQPYFHYTGSLTTPPCKGGVDFYVLARPLIISPGQRDALQAMVKSAMRAPENNRRPQELNTRPVQYLTYK